MRRTNVGGAALLLAVLAMTGCQSSAGAIPPVGSGPLVSASTEASGPLEDSGAVPGAAPPCGAVALAGVKDVVSSQLAAFKARDFEAAFALASSQFQSFSTVQWLHDLIMDGRHEEVADSASYAFTECRQPQPDLALASVSVTGANGRTVLLVYQFILEGGAWRILQSAPMNGQGGTSPQPGASGLPA